MQENIEMLNIIYENANMAVHTIETLIKKIKEKENKITLYLEKELKEYQDYQNKTEKLLKKNKIDLKKPTIMAKIGSDMGIKMEVKKDNSDAAIASMVIEGITMGIVKMQAKIESYKKTIDKKTLTLASDFLKFQQQEITNLKTFM